MLIYLQTIETEEDKSKFEDIYREYRGLILTVRRTGQLQLIIAN